MNSLATRARLLLRSGVFVVAASVLDGCGNILTDAATRFGRDLCDEAAAMRLSGETRHTFEHRPIARPEGIAGDYRVEIVVSEPNRDGYSLLLVGESYDGPLRYSTTSHCPCVRAEKSFRAPHRKGEPTNVTLESRGRDVWITDVK